MTVAPTIAIIGTGNMGASLISGLIKSNHPPKHIVAFDHHETKLDLLRETFHIQTKTSAEEALIDADILIFAVKPNHLLPLASRLTTHIQAHHPLIISVAAGITIADLQDIIGKETPIVRAMPNTPAMIGCSATALFANAHVNQVKRDLAESVMRSIGMIVWLTHENQLDVVTALSGSGPAYFFLIMEVMQEAAESLSLPAETARLLTLETALGAARMAIESGQAVATLREHVTSKGGTTEAAISVLENHHIRSLFKEALTAAKERSETLSKRT